MVQRQKNPFIFIAIAVVVMAVSGYLIQTNEGLRAFLFPESGPTEFYIGPDRLEQITDQIRDNTRDRWLETVITMQEQVDRIDQTRQKLFERIATSVKSEAYLDEFVKLSANHHQKTEDVDLSQPEVPLNEVYEAAKNAEKRITNYYRDICGARIVINQQVPAIDAVSWVKVVPPRRISLEGEALDQAIRSQADGSLEAFKRNIKNGAASIAAMEKNIEKILEKAGLDDEENTGEGWEQMSEIAFGSTQGETLMPDELSLDDDGTSDGGFGARPGRIISPTRLKNQNLFIDTWYVMGPFENRFRSNLDSSFLPESVIDLDNSTIGKNDEEIRWEYWRSKKQRIEPDWAPRGAVYYGWTEVFMEEEGNYWVSLGSDDYGKLWVNGELVWKSDTRPKSYRADEYTAEIAFKKGINELLFRCENNGGTMGWSVIFHTAAME